MKYRYCLLIFAAAIVLSGCSVKWEGIQAKGYKAFQGIPIGTHSLDLYELYTQDADHFECAAAQRMMERIPLSSGKKVVRT